MTDMDNRGASRLTTVERNRLAKLRFWNGDTNNAAKPPNPLPVPYIDLTVPGTPVCTKYLAALREQEHRLEDEKLIEQHRNPFATFLESMDKLKSGTLTNRDSDNILSTLIKLEQQAEANGLDEDAEEVSSFGYRNVGTFNGGSNLRIYPSVRRSLSRRASVDSMGYQSDNHA